MMNDRNLALTQENLPSIVAHSFGTYILGYSLLRYKNIRFDKVILCGSILPQDFPWTAILDRGQVTAVRNEYGAKDVWSKLAHWLVAGTGPSGQSGFWFSHPNLMQERFDFEHSEYFNRGHIIDSWLKFMDLPFTRRPIYDTDVHPPRSNIPWALYGLYTVIFLAAALSIFHPSQGLAHYLAAWGLGKTAETSSMNEEQELLLNIIQADNNKPFTYQDPRRNSTEFERAMLTPISVNTIADLIVSYPRETVLYLAIEELKLISGKTVTVFHNRPDDDQDFIDKTGALIPCKDIFSKVTVDGRPNPYQQLAKITSDLYVPENAQYCSFSKFFAVMRILESYGLTAVRRFGPQGPQGRFCFEEGLADVINRATVLVMGNRCDNSNPPQNLAFLSLALRSSLSQISARRSKYLTILARCYERGNLIR
jgi:hypothetical protein